MGNICCCCDDDTRDEQRRAAEFRQRRSYNNGGYSATSSSAGANRRAASAGSRGGQHQPTTARTPPPRVVTPQPPSDQCKYCGHRIDPAFLDGHQETCRINLKKKESEMRANDGQVVTLRVFDLNPDTEYDDDQVCVVCMNALRSYAIVPCGHLIACGLCAKQLDKCPMCRKERQGLLFVDPTEELRTTCKSCKNVIHPAYFDGHREVCALQMRQLKQLMEAEERELEGAGDGANIEGPSNPTTGTPSPALQAQLQEQLQDDEEFSDRGDGAMLLDSGGATAATKPMFENADGENALGESNPVLIGAVAATPGRSARDEVNQNTTPTISGSPSRGVSPSARTATGGSPSSAQGPLAHTGRAMCVECRSAPVEVAFIPCGHSCMCVACGERATMCPTCFGAVSSTMQTFK